MEITRLLEKFALIIAIVSKAKCRRPVSACRIVHIHLWGFEEIKQFISKCTLRAFLKNVKLSEITFPAATSENLPLSRSLFFSMSRGYRRGPYEAHLQFRVYST
jgi:hypothetical protein